MEGQAEGLEDEWTDGMAGHEDRQVEKQKKVVQTNKQKDRDIGARVNFQGGGGGEKVRMDRIAPQITRADSFLTRVKFSHAAKLLDSLSNIRNTVLNGEEVGVSPL